MWFWLFMLVMTLLIPLTMIVLGNLYRHGAIGDINSWFGYRSSMSMKNQDTWDFAHHYAGRLWHIAGWICVPFTFAAMIVILLICPDADAVGTGGGIVCLLQGIPLLGTVIVTERALRRTFDRDGRRKEEE